MSARWLVLLVACGAKPPPAVPAPARPKPPLANDELTIHFHAPALGAKFHDVRQITIATDPPVGHVENVTRVDKTVELLAIDHGVVTTARVRYDVDRKISQVKDQSGVKASALEGHTFELQSSGAGMAVLGEDGTPVDASLAAQVLADQHIGAIEDPFTSFLDGRTFTVGEAVDVPAQALSALISAPGSELTAVSVVFRGTRAGLASFDLSVHLSSDSGGQLTTIDLSGSVGVDPSIGMATAMTFTGPVHISGAAGGGGTLTIENQHTLVK
jgi:hypothetical protein